MTMAARKLQQEVDKVFKKVAEGVAEFEAIYEKIEQSTNAAQKEKLEDNLKKEIKKLQRHRDQIKTWAASNEIKDKGPLLEQRKLIETQMEKFKAVEKAMKTKAYSKEGLLSAAKLDPKERAKMETCEFLGNMVEELERQIETLEAEGESIQATMKKGKNQSSKTDRLAEIERISGRHRWHQGKLELIKRSLENGAVETEQVTDLQETIEYYVKEGMNEDYMEDEEMYDELNLQDEEDIYGMNVDNDRVSSQDNQSVQEDTPDPEVRSSSAPKPKPTTTEPPTNTGRRPSAQLRSPLPALATLHTPMTTVPSGSASTNMKPAVVPTRPPGETLKYATAAAAAAAADKMGIAPLPPPPEPLSQSNSSSSAAPLPTLAARQPSATSSPSISHSQVSSQATVKPTPLPALSDATNSRTQSPAPANPNAGLSVSELPQPKPEKIEKSENIKASTSRAVSGKSVAASELAESSKAPVSQTNGVSNGVKAVPAEDDESIYHLPSGLQDLLQSFEVTQHRVTDPLSQSTQRMLNASYESSPSINDVRGPRNFKHENRISTPSYYPQELDPVFEDPRLYGRIDADTLFYVFYYKQGSYQQYLAAKALKDQSWRFHTQYQTWFQRHEEPKTITEEYEQGTYRFFDYESTWMNRRKADFKFAYKFLEDTV